MGEWRKVRYYELDAEDEDARCADIARNIAGIHVFLWFWLPPDVKPRRNPDVWDHQPGVPMVAPPHMGERIVLEREVMNRDDSVTTERRTYVVLRAHRVRAKNFGWVVVT